ncbi:DUF222 domain-containing protein [Pseudonocardia nigra]|uniref:DUF222 domain-containing protein n=1 Tax=Pseudonocardia nigra TaxID=1921578 RepID=UPI001C5F0396
MRGHRARAGPRHRRHGGGDAAARTFADRGYKNPAAALADLLGWERFEARRRITAADQVSARANLDGTPLPARLPATAAAFAAGAIGLRHVEVIATLMASPAAERIDADRLAHAEPILAERAAEYTPTQLHTWSADLIDKLDQDGPEPDDNPPGPDQRAHDHPAHRAPRRHRERPVRRPSAVDNIAALRDAKAKPSGTDDHRMMPQRQAEALAEICGYVLDHGDVPECGGLCGVRHPAARLAPRVTAAVPGRGAQAGVPVPPPHRRRRNPEDPVRAQPHRRPHRRPRRHHRHHHPPR